jgi:hypothetical protein
MAYAGKVAREESNIAHELAKKAAADAGISEKASAASMRALAVAGQSAANEIADRSAHLGAESHNFFGGFVQLGTFRTDQEQAYVDSQGVDPSGQSPDKIRASAAATAATFEAQAAAAAAAEAQAARMASYETARDLQAERNAANVEHHAADQAEAKATTLVEAVEAANQGASAVDENDISSAAIAVQSAKEKINSANVLSYQADVSMTTAARMARMQINRGQAAIDLAKSAAAAGQKHAREAAEAEHNAQVAAANEAADASASLPSTF